MRYKTIASRVNKDFTVLIPSIKYYFNETVTHSQVIINLDVQIKQIKHFSVFHYFADKVRIQKYKKIDC